MRNCYYTHIILYVYSNTHYFKLDTYDYSNLVYSVIANKCKLANEYVVQYGYSFNFNATR